MTGGHDRAADHGHRCGGGHSGHRRSSGCRARRLDRCRGRRSSGFVVELELRLRLAIAGRRTRGLGGVTTVLVAILVIAVAVIIQTGVIVQAIAAGSLLAIATTTTTATATAATTARAAFAIGVIAGARGIGLFTVLAGGNLCFVHGGRGLRAVLRGGVRRGGVGHAHGSGGHQCGIGDRCGRVARLRRIGLRLACRLVAGHGLVGIALLRLGLLRVLLLLQLGLLLIARLLGLLFVARLGLARCLHLCGIAGHRCGDVLAALVTTLVLATAFATLATFTAVLATALALRLCAAIAVALATAFIAAAAIAVLVAILVAVGAVAALGRACVRRRGSGRGRFATEDALEPAHHASGGRCGHRGRGSDRCGRGFRFRGFADRRRLAVLDLGHHRGHRDVQLGLGQRVHRQLARGTALIARLAAFFAQLVVTQAGHFVMRGVQLFVGDDHDRRVMALFDLAQGAALFIEQVVGDLDRGLDQHLPGVLLHRMLFSHADDRQRQRLDAAHAAMAVATRAHDLAGFAQARAQALAAHFHQAKARDAAQLHARTVVLERVLQAVFNFALVLVGGHVDEIDDHQAAQVAQAQLAGHFFGRFQVGLERGVLDVAALGGARGVDVDGGQRFGLVDHDRTAGGQAHVALIRAFDLRFDLEAVEQRDVVGVVLELAQGLRHHLLHELAGGLVQFLGVHQDLADVGAQVVTQGAHDQARLLVDQEGGRLGQRRFGDRLPHLQQVIQIPLQLFGIAADAGGADDHAHVVGDVQLVQRFLQRGAVFTLDATRHAASGGRVRHQHHVAAGQRDERGQGGALVATLFLVDLDNHFLAFTQQFADAGLVVVHARGEVIARDFLQRQEAVALAAVFDEGRFQRRFKARDAALVDVRLLLFLGRLFDVDVVQRLAIHDGYPQLFSLRGIDQHSLHCWVPRALLPRGTPWGFASGHASTPIAQARGGRLGFPALQHHGSPRERFICFGLGVTGPEAAVSQAGAPQGHVFQHRRLSGIRRWPGPPVSR